LKAFGFWRGGTCRSCIQGNPIGLCNSHVWVTTVRDRGGFHYVDIALKNAIREGTVVGPRMQVAGKLISQTGGHCYFMGVEADGPEGVRIAARAQLKAGADIVKMMATGGGATPGQNVQAQQLTVEELAAGAEVARREFKKSAAHAHGTVELKTLCWPVWTPLSIAAF
jgi:imidazolonepropionase-like amidohydrolase